MTRQQFVQLLYQEPQPSTEIKEKILKGVEIHACKTKLPEKDGEYLVYHATYGWCVYGYTVKDRWGYDDEVVRRDGTKFNKVIEWGNLSLEKS